MWIKQSDYEYYQRRVGELEVQLATERAENRRRENWMCGMLMRRGGSFPVPESKPPKPDKPADTIRPPQLSAVEQVQREAYRAEAKRLKLQVGEADLEFDKLRAH